jgi:hypothetical protein
VRCSSPWSKHETGLLNRKFSLFALTRERTLQSTASTRISQVLILPTSRAVSKANGRRLRTNCLKFEDDDREVLKVVVNRPYRDPWTSSFLQGQSDLCAAILPQYQLADKVLVPHFQNHLVDGLRLRLLDNKSYTGRPLKSDKLVSKQTTLRLPAATGRLDVLHYPKKYNDTLEQKFADVIREDLAWEGLDHVCSRMSCEEPRRHMEGDWLRLPQSSGWLRVLRI